MNKPAFGSQREALTIKETLFSSSDSLNVVSLRFSLWIKRRHY